MVEMKTLTIGGVTYEIVDKKTRDNIGNIEDLATPNKTCLVAAINDAYGNGGGGSVDDVLFTDNFIVGAAVGGFKVGDSLQNLTLKEILTKILDAKVMTEPESIVDLIIANEIPMLSGSADGLQTTAFSYFTMASDEAAVAPTASGFYQIVEDGVVTESGYQLFTESTGRTEYAMALPEGAAIVKVYMWDTLTNSWLDYSPVFTETGTTTVDGYTYVTYESDDSSSGEVLRFVIE